MVMRISLVTGAAISVGLTRRSASVAPRDRFPYVAAPVGVAQPVARA